MAAKPTARQQVGAAAAANGWARHSQDDWDRTMNVDEYRKSRKYIRVQFTVHGAIVAASSDNRRMIGTGKLAQVLTRITN